LLSFGVKKLSEPISLFLFKDEQIRKLFSVYVVLRRTKPNQGGDLREYKLKLTRGLSN